MAQATAPSWTMLVLLALLAPSAGAVVQVTVDVALRAPDLIVPQGETWRFSGSVTKIGAPWGAGGDVRILVDGVEAWRGRATVGGPFSGSLPAAFAPGAHELVVTYADRLAQGARAYEWRLITPPGPTEIVSATQVRNADRVKLVWAPPADDGGLVQGYRLERDAGAGFVPLAALPASTLNFTDEVVANHSYAYRVRAENEAGPGPFGAAFPFTAGPHVVADAATLELVAIQICSGGTCSWKASGSEVVVSERAFTTAARYRGTLSAGGAPLPFADDVKLSSRTTIAWDCHPGTIGEICLKDLRETRNATASTDADGRFARDVAGPGTTPSSRCWYVDIAGTVQQGAASAFASGWVHVCQWA